MLRALKLQKLWPQALFASPSPYDISPKVSGIRFRQAVQGANHNRPESSHKRAQAHDEELEVGDPLTSLGEEYATRCEGEGFGGVIYGKKENSSKDEEENAKSQGSKGQVDEKDQNKKQGGCRE